MSDLERRLALVDRERGGVVLERSLSQEGWEVTRIVNPRALAVADAAAYGAMIIALDPLDGEMFDLLVRMSHAMSRPTMLLLSRRSLARTFSSEVLEALHVDGVLAWPCRVSAIQHALETVRANADYESLRFVS